ncbi:hypothetical protein M433DRAFT_235693 [Acidomyces richmondensis BFW]|nr:MAG: hypothetical protein FE78DRAFT_380016 [Acidomyces sp. 'richmondensis']KYG45850.1 hypothetical protein M433DRAFT_235693 [Acidomyces richmondensis BFW]
MSFHLVRAYGIYHGSPVYSQDISGLTTIITGANGISGHYMLRVLAQDPNRWKKIFRLSRRPPMIPDGLPSNAEHIPLEFLKDPSDIAKVLENANVTADYVFFYIQPGPKPGKGIWSDADELVRVNSLLLSNFAEALQLANIRPKRSVLQTGAKNYGGHLGSTKVPQVERDSRLTLEPNFSYSQEDIVEKYCEETGCAWNVYMPGPILGTVPDAAMNGAFPLAVYAAICRKLGQLLDYPGDI